MLANELQIYKDTYLFVKDYIGVYGQIKNLHKHTLGKQIYNNALSLFACIDRANREVQDKTSRNKYLTEYQIILNNISTLLRLAHDTKVITSKHHAYLSAKIVLLGRQVSGMKKGTGQGRDTQA